HLAEVARDLRGDGSFEHGEERLERLDRKPRLLEVAVRFTQAAVAERADRVERLDEEVAHLQLPQLVLEVAEQLLVAALSQRAAPAAPRRSARASRLRRRAGAGARPRSGRAPRGTTRRRARPRPAASTRSAAR